MGKTLMPEEGVDIETASLKDLLDTAERFQNGDSFVMEKGGPHVIVCCDCGLTHTIEIEEQEDGRFKVITFRAGAMTLAFRRDSKHYFPYNPYNNVDNREDNVTSTEEKIDPPAS